MTFALSLSRQVVARARRYPTWLGQLLESCRSRPTVPPAAPRVSGFTRRRLGNDCRAAALPPVALLCMADMPTSAAIKEGLLSIDAEDGLAGLLLGPVLHEAIKGVYGFFNDDEPRPNDGSQHDALLQALDAGNAPGILSRPDGSSALRDAADRAADAYERTGGAAAATDTQVAVLLKKYLETNEATRMEVTALIKEIQSREAQLAKNPTALNDPLAIKAFGELLDDRLGKIQQALERAKVDNAHQAELLGVLTNEYHAVAATADQHTPKDGASQTDTAANGGSGGGATATGGGVDPAVAGGGAVADPLGGMGVPSSMGGLGDPMSMLGPAFAGMSSIPASLGGLASSLPAAAMGIAPLAGQLAGVGEGDRFSDRPAREGAKGADFNDDHAKDPPRKPAEAAGDDHDSKDKNPEGSPVPAVTPAALNSAVPATAGGDPSLVVQMPDGSPVTATSAQHASAVRAVINGTSVADAWRGAHVSLPPPGTPITEPADPSHLTPGTLAQFKTREPIMYMGNGKIWLDGQLQPQSTLPTTDFLGWVDPAQQAGPAASAAASARSTGT